MSSFCIFSSHSIFKVLCWSHHTQRPQRMGCYLSGMLLLASKIPPSVQRLVQNQEGKGSEQMNTHFLGRKQERRIEAEEQNGTMNKNYTGLGKRKKNNLKWKTERNVGAMQTVQICFSLHLNSLSKTYLKQTLYYSIQPASSSHTQTEIHSLFLLQKIISQATSPRKLFLSFSFDT